MLLVVYLVYHQVLKLIVILKTQQQIVGTADKQAKIALNAYENGVIDLYTYTNTMRDINKTKAMSEISDAQIVNCFIS